MMDTVREIVLIDEQSLKNYNNGYCYMFFVIDGLIKFGWVEPMKEKSARTSLKALSAILPHSRDRAPMM